MCSKEDRTSDGSKCEHFQGFLLYKWCSTYSGSIYNGSTYNSSTYKFSTLKVKVKSISCVWLSATPWAIDYQASSSMGFSRQEYWSGLPFPSPGDLPDPGIEPRSPTLQADGLPSEPPFQLSDGTKAILTQKEMYCEFWSSPRLVIFSRTLSWCWALAVSCKSQSTM